MIQVNKSRHVLLICNDTVGQNMAGPGIRYWEFSRLLSNYFTVTLAIPPFVQQDTIPRPSFQADIRRCSEETELYRVVERADVIVTVGDVLSMYPRLLNSSKPMVLDVYIPALLETLNAHSHPTPTHQDLFFCEKGRNALNTQLRVADFMICASEKQRDYWLGMLSALGRLNPYTHNDDKTLRHLIDVVPFGLPREKPVHTKQVLKGVYKGIEPEDLVIIWSGGIWEWLDAPTLIKALPLVIQQLPQVKLFFMGVKRPNRVARQAVDEAITLSQELGLYDTHIFFNEWVPYSERQNYLLEADLSVSLHLNHVETQFAFRTRFLDNLWTGLPLLATEGDFMSAELVSLNLARTVKAQNIPAVTQAIIEMLQNRDEYRRCYQTHYESIVAKYNWADIVQPLIDFCANPRFAPDKSYLQTTPVTEIGPTPYWKLPGKAWKALKINGFQGLFWQLKKYVLWKQGKK